MANTSANKTSGAKSMADLMASYKTSFNTFRKGDLVKGHVLKLTKNEILVDVNSKTAAVVLEKDKTMLHSLLAMLSVGDEVEVSILNPESDAGNPVVSLRRFLSNSVWGKLEEAKNEEKQIQVRITDTTKGGLIVQTESGLSGFLPNSHIGGGEALSVGKSIKVRPIEINRADNKIIFSQKITISASAFDEAVKQLKTGSSADVTVMNVVPFGVFVSVKVGGITLDGLIHISEISWEKVDDISQLYSSGQNITAKIIGFDKNTRRVDLSIKQLTKDPFTGISEQFPLEKKVSATILRVDDTGVTIDLGKEVEGLIRKDKIPPTVTYHEGQTITATVSEIDKRRRKIYLVPVLLEKPLMYR